MPIPDVPELRVVIDRTAPLARRTSCSVKRIEMRRVLKGLELDYLSAGFAAGKQPDEKHLWNAFVIFE